jgi:hypothetical protein
MNSSNCPLGVVLDRLYCSHVDPWLYVLYRLERLGHGDLNSSGLVRDDLDGPHRIPKELFLDDLDGVDDLGLVPRELFLGCHHDIDLNLRWRVLDGVDLNPKGLVLALRRASGRKTCSKICMPIVLLGCWRVSSDVMYAEERKHQVNKFL